MRGMISILLAILLAMFCWGVYGPVLARGQMFYHFNYLHAFICVGLAYFVIAVVAPIVALQLFGEKGHWTAKGTTWSLIAGAAGAIGALGILLALHSGGSPLFVMPLVFGCAPIVNTFLTMYMAKTYKQVGPVFIAGLIVVLIGAITVLMNKPSTPHPKAAPQVADEQSTEPTAPAESKGPTRLERAQNFGVVVLFTVMTALAWGAYGPTLHKGQMAMAGSRLRPLICVGVSYFLIAVLVPLLMLSFTPTTSEITFGGAFWSLLGGAAGAIGALGIIMAFNFGGKPVYVMPLVFGGAPVINTFASIMQAGTYDQIGPVFYAGLLLVIGGAVTILVFAPKGAPHAPAANPPAGEKPATAPAH
jgi:hypothetical protein